jgi:hypothetical protein
MAHDIVVLDSVVLLTEQNKGCVAFCASHGGDYAGYFAAKMGVAAVILNDAGIGKEAAGLAGVKMLDELGVPAATVSHRSARIGDGTDGAARGILSFVNEAAKNQGLGIGMSCREALALLASRDLQPSPAPEPLTEARFEHVSTANSDVKIIVMDSISLVKPGDEGHIAVAASHGAILGSNPEIGVRFPLLAAICVDADRGIDDAGVSRLAALDKHGIAGACASAFSARIGDGRSLYKDGIISALNETARAQGAEIGMRVKDLAELFAKKQSSPDGRTGILI